VFVSQVKFDKKKIQSKTTKVKKFLLAHKAHHKIHLQRVKKIASDNGLLAHQSSICFFKDYKVLSWVNTYG